MGNHEYCEDCGKNDYHHHRPCNPEDVASHLKISLEQAKRKIQCQPLDKQPGYKEIAACFAIYRKNLLSDISGDQEILDELH